jgi:flagellum-specific peptidoglycan hydrolase FlgJ
MTIRPTSATPRPATGPLAAKPTTGPLPAAADSTAVKKPAVTGDLNTATTQAVALPHVDHDAALDAALANLPAPAKVEGYGSLFGTQGYVKDAQDAKLLDLMKKAVDKAPELKNSPLAAHVAAGKLEPGDVAALQHFLQSKGYDVGSMGADGKYGPRTHAAMAAFLNGEAPPAPSHGGGAAPAHLSKLADMSRADLKQLGATDHKAFLDALRPAAEEAEKKYGVPAAVTLAQAALETGWGQHVPEGFNLFGIKGSGPAGTINLSTREVVNGKDVTIKANFAKYHSFEEAVTEHGKLFHNGHYDKAISQFAQDKDPYGFVKNMGKIYATDPNYIKVVTQIMHQYNLA